MLVRDKRHFRVRSSATVQTKGLDPSAINTLIKSLGQACQFNFTDELSSHSFRRVLSTSAARENVDFEAIKKTGGWKQGGTVREYIDEGRQFPTMPL